MDKFDALYGRLSESPLGFKKIALLVMYCPLLIQHYFSFEICLHKVFTLIDVSTLADPMKSSQKTPRKIYSSNRSR